MIIDLYNNFDFGVDFVLRNSHLLECANTLPKVAYNVMSYSITLITLSFFEFIKDWVLPSSFPIFAWFQFSITKQKRKDDLFDKRYEFYNEIIKIVQDFEPKLLLKYKRQKFTLNRTYNDRYESQFLEFISYDPNPSGELSLFQDFQWIDQLVLNKKKQKILSIAGFLFDAQLVEFLDKFFTKKNLENVIRKHYRTNYTEEEILLEWDRYIEYSEQNLKKSSSPTQAISLHLEIVEFSKQDLALRVSTPWFPFQEEFNEQFGRFLTILN